MTVIILHFLMFLVDVTFFLMMTLQYWDVISVNVVGENMIKTN